MSAERPAATRAERDAALILEAKRLIFEAALDDRHPLQLAAAQAAAKLLAFIADPPLAAKSPRGNLYPLRGGDLSGLPDGPAA